MTDGTGEPALRSIRGFRVEDRAEVLEVELASFDADPVPGESRAEVAWMVERIAVDPGSTLVAIDDRRIVGVCTPRADYLAVHPAHRRRGHGRRLVEAARAHVGRLGIAELQLWGDIDRVAAGSFIRALGFTYRSSLWMLVLRADRAVPAAAFPDDVVVRRIEPGVDDGPYVRLMNRAFEDHPSPLSWSEGYIREMHTRPDFDRDGVLIVAPAAAPEQMIGMCRTIELPADDGRGRGEVSVIGVLPEWRSRGLGRQLVRWGVNYLRGRGFAEIELTVEARNARALELYRAEGFEAAVEWPHFVLPAT